MTHAYQKKYLYITLGFIILICVSAYILQKPNGQSAYPTVPVEETKGIIFTDAQNRFSLTVPEGALVITDKKAMQGIGYFPSCNTDTALACMFFASTTYPNSNFQGASISINETSAKTESECLTQNEFEQRSEGNVAIGEVLFARFSADDAAMSHQSAGTDYRTFKNGTCYEITSRINTTTFEVYAEGSIQEFTNAELAEIEQKLDNAVQSFVFGK